MPSPPARTIPRAMNFSRLPLKFCWCGRLGADTWETLVRPGRKMPVGERIVFGDGELEALVEARGEYGLRVLRFSVAGTASTKRSRGWATFRCRPTSSAKTSRLTASAIRRCSRDKEAPWLRPQPDCILRPRFWSGCAIAELKSRRSRLMWDSARSSRFARSGWKITRFTLRLTRFRSQPRPRSSERGRRIGRCWLWGLPWCGRSKMQRRKMQGVCRQLPREKRKRKYFCIPGRVSAS